MLEQNERCLAQNSSIDNFLPLLVEDLVDKGYSLQSQAFDLSLARQMRERFLSLDEAELEQASIGRQDQLLTNPKIRANKLHWIMGETEAEKAWLAWANDLRLYLNKHLFLGLFSFESHFALYEPGDFYQRHVDAFKGDASRLLSVVLYLNEEWFPGDGGELVVYQNEQDQQGIKFLPIFASVAVFLSEDIPHEVLPTLKNRYSIAGWFRVNSSSVNRVDPPL